MGLAAAPDFGVVVFGFRLFEDGAVVSREGPLGPWPPPVRWASLIGISRANAKKTESASSKSRVDFMIGVSFQVLPGVPTRRCLTQRQMGRPSLRLQTDFEVSNVRHFSGSDNV